MTVTTATSPKPQRRSELVSAALAALLAAAVLLPLLGHHPLTDWDEGIYAEVSREMLRGHSWLVPLWNGQPWLEKPPLMLWITAACFKLFGVSALWARAGSALAGVATVAVLHGWTVRHRGRLEAWLGTVVLLASFGFQHVCRVGEMDALLSLGCLIGVLGLTNVGRGELRGWYAFWGGFAVALMTKSGASLPLLLTAALFAAMLVFERRRQRGLGTVFGRPCLLGLLGCLALVLPWHLFMLERFGAEFVRQYLGFHMLHRATSQIEGHLTHGWYYVVVLLVSAPLLSLLYPVALVESFRRRELRGLRAFALFALVEFTLFSLVQTRLPHYIAPAYPAFAVITGGLLGSWLRRVRPARRVVWIGLGAAVFLLFALATTRKRSELHSPHLPNGDVTPSNLEAVALLAATRAETAEVPGPLLVWEPGRFVPVTTSMFYARREAQQVEVGAVAPGQPRDKYTFDPVSLARAVAEGPRLLLVDRALLPSLPPGVGWRPVQLGPTQAVGVVSPLPAGTRNH